MADVSVRPARLADVERVVAIQRRVWSEPDASNFAVIAVESLDIDAMTRAWERAVLVPPTKRHRLVVALADDMVVGAAATAESIDPDLGESADEIVLLIVDPDHRGAGHGSRLMHAVADLAQATDVHVLSAWLPSTADRVRVFFESFGWAADGAYRTVELTSPDESADSVRTVRELRYATSLG